MFGLRALWIDCLEGCKDAARVFHKQLKENNCEIPTLLENVHSKLEESCSGQNIRFFTVSCCFPIIVFYFFRHEKATSFFRLRGGIIHP